MLRLVLLSAVSISRKYYDQIKNYILCLFKRRIYSDTKKYKKTFYRIKKTAAVVESSCCSTINFISFQSFSRRFVRFRPAKLGRTRWATGESGEAKRKQHWIDLSSVRRNLLSFYFWTLSLTSTVGTFSLLDSCRSPKFALTHMTCEDAHSVYISYEWETKEGRCWRSWKR